MQQIYITNNYRRLYFLLMVCLISASSYAENIWDGTIATAFAGGDGSESNPYQIATASQYEYWAQQSATDDFSGKYIKLTEDITFNTTYTTYTSVGTFSGIFDGNGHTFTINRNAASSTFYFVSTNNGTIKNLYFQSTCGGGGKETVSSGSSLVSTNQTNGIITNCYLSDEGSYTLAGYPIAADNYGTITYCYITGHSYSSNYDGGVIVRNHNGTLKYCHSNYYSAGHVTGYYWTVQPLTTSWATCDKNVITVDQWKQIVNIDPHALTLTDDAPTITAGVYPCDYVTYTRTLTTDKYATFCLPFDINTADVSNALSKIYTIDNNCIYNNGTLTLTATKTEATTINAGTPFVALCSASNVEFKNATAVTYQETTANPNAKSLNVSGGNVTVSVGGTYSKLTSLDKTKYYAFTVEPKIGPTQSLNPFRAYIKNESAGGAKVSNIAFGIGDDTTAINEVATPANDNVEMAIFNLHGQRISKNTLPPGIYIINGVKTLIK